MSVASVITGGFGSFGSVALVIRSGYATASPAPTPTVTPPLTIMGAMPFQQGSRAWPDFIADGDDDVLTIRRRKRREKEEKEVIAMVKAFLRTLN